MACYLTTGRSILQEYWLSSFFVVGLKTYRYDGVDYTEMKRRENGVTTAFVEGYVLISITLLHELWLSFESNISQLFQVIFKSYIISALN